MMRPIINPPLQQSTTTTAEATNTSTASSSVAGNWTAYVTDSDDVIFPSSSGEFSNLQIGNRNASCNNSKLLDGKCFQSCANNNNNNNNNINNNNISHQKHKIKIATGNGNNINVNINCERKTSFKTNSDKSSESTNILDSCLSDCDEIFTIKSKTNPIAETSSANTDDESNKLNANLECAPLIELSPSKSITLVKQNSTSLIFTKKDINPVVHRKRITLVRSGAINISNDKLTTDSSDVEPIISHTNETITSPKKRHSFHWQSDRNGFPNSTDKSKRKQIKSWYAVISGETEKYQENYKNVACTTTMQNNYKKNNERAVQPKLNHNHQQKFQEFSDHKHRKTAEKSLLYRPNSIDVQDVGHATTHITKYNRFEQLLKSLVGRKVSREPSSIATSHSTSSIIGSNGVNRATLDKEYPQVDNNHLDTPLIFASPEIKISRAPSAHNLFRNDQFLTTTSSTSTTSLNATMHQRLWSVVPLLRREGSSTSLNQSSIKPLIHQRHDIGLKKCETVSALTHSQTTSSFEPVRPRNRLRQSQSIATCSRCSSILSLAANGSRYSLNIANGGFVSIKNDLVSDKSRDVTDQPTVIKSSSTAFSLSSIGCLACKLCLNDIKPDKMFKILHCGCQFCIDCMKTYVEFEILEGAYDISCPDALCPLQGIMNIEQDMAKLVSSDLIEKHTRFRLNREIELDKNRTWCPRAGCETICLVEQSARSNGLTTSIVSLTPVAVKCPTCVEEFCSSCKKTWHPTFTCEENAQRLAANGTDDSIGIPFDSDLIKCCPMCGVPIEKDEGCAQMMCKRCKHVFCWYCLASLDDDFLLRHYDKGPCKNKLGHSRASVVWHRAQVIGIFASFGILLLVASPLLLLAAPCIVCCKCRLCSAKIEDVDADDFDPNDPQQNTR